jgi:hypothetical protein
MRQYRLESRTPCNSLAELSWEIGAGYIRNTKATVIDLSKSGMALMVAQPFRVGAMLKIVSGNKAESGVVRHCVKQGTKHLLGIKLER